MFYQIRHISHDNFIAYFQTIDQKEALLPWQPQTWNKAKSKNHTNHNQNRKHHRNPTRKPNRLGMDPKFLKNPKFAKKHNMNKTQLVKKAAKYSLSVLNSTDCHFIFKEICVTKKGVLCFNR